jgi:hypothetical protein
MPDRAPSSPALPRRKLDFGVYWWHIFAYKDKGVSP